MYHCVIVTVIVSSSSSFCHRHCVIVIVIGYILAILYAK